MKKFMIICLGFVMLLGLVACGMTDIPEETPVTEPADDSPIYSCLYACKETIHEELFEEQTPESQLVIDLLFEELEVKPIDSKFHEDGILVTADVTNINAGTAVVEVFKEYAMLCAENAFSANPMSSTALYNKYADMLKTSFKDAKRITRTVDILMEKEGDIWVCDLDENAIDAMTGNLFSALAIEALLDANLLVLEKKTIDMDALMLRAEAYKEVYDVSNTDLTLLLLAEGYSLDAINLVLQSLEK